MNNMIRSICGILGIILTAISIIASSGYILNESNRVQNKSIQSSSTYKQLEEGKIIQKDLYGTKKEELKRLQTLQEQQKIDGKNIVNNSSIKNKAGRGVEVQSKISKTQEQINAIQNELTRITSELQKPIDVKNVNFKAENGYIALFQLLADKLNNLESFKESPTTADRLLTYFLMFISAVFEILAVVLYIINRKILSAIAFVISFAFTCFLMVSMAFGIIACVLAGLMAFVMDFSKVVMLKIAFDGNVNYLSPTSPKNKSFTNLKSKLDNIKSFKIPKRSDSPITARKIGFDMENKKNPNIIKFDKVSDFNDGDLKKYIEYMNATAIDGISQGYCKIAKNIGIPVNKANKIKGYLEQKNIIKTIGGKTEIIKNI
jgi:hypothetical protein